MKVFSFVFGSESDLSRTQAIKQVMIQAQREIDDGIRQGATILYRKSGGRSFWERQQIRNRWSRVIRFGSKGV